MSGRKLKRRQAGQALTEMALILPVLMLLTLGTADLARGFYFNIETSGASRAGMRAGILNGSGFNLGNEIRSEPNSAIANDDVTWGAEGPSGTNSCSGTNVCGDANGCVASSFTATQLACFAVQTCTQDPASNTYTVCTSGWTVRPTSRSGAALQVKVVYKFRPTTPIIINLAGPGGNFYPTGTTTGVETY
ncbi:MAG: hypothetical protein NVSMB17_15920 [Candidatus Dormibacteria bacterium]